MVPVKVGVIVNVMELIALADVEEGGGGGGGGSRGGGGGGVGDGGSEENAPGFKALRVCMGLSREGGGGNGIKEFGTKMMEDGAGAFMLECIDLDFPLEDAMPQV
jgi:hypothetical protein